MNDITLSERIKLTLPNIPSKIKKQFSFMLHQKVYVFYADKYEWDVKWLLQQLYHQFKNGSITRNGIICNKIPS